MVSLSLLTIVIGDAIYHYNQHHLTIPTSHAPTHPKYQQDQNQPLQPLLQLLRQALATRPHHEQPRPGPERRSACPPRLPPFHLQL